MNLLSAAVAVLAVLAAIILLVLNRKEREKNMSSLNRYSRIADLEVEGSRLAEANIRLENEAAELRKKLSEDLARKLTEFNEVQERRAAEDRAKRETLTGEYEHALRLHQELKKEIELMEDSLEDISFGIYQPHFTYESPEDYKARIELLRSQQRDAVRSGRAAQSFINWTVNASQSEGQRMMRLYSKLILRAFNGECEAAIANVTWNNAPRMEERIRKAFTDINKLGDVGKLSISDLYLMLKIEELRITNEYEQKRYQLREQQRRVREQIREEEKTQKEIEVAIEESRTEEERFSEAIARAKDEATQAMGMRLEKLTSQISTFEAKLDEARRKKERAIARAQFTKSGFVYVISNIGSFGERVFKIGMTRRLEPMDRVYELSGASVPFPYDLHAMMYCDDAPALEGDLHRVFRDRRLNLINARREFFRDVEFEEIETYIREKGLSAQFLKIPEAREYRATLAMRQKSTSPGGGDQRTKFPDTPFAAVEGTEASSD